ncbi:response regulator [Burkholderia sp. Ac-20353]|uniref:phosphorylase family protein n=1 Tax=Burkholderia sp. Ac-20353 TaxID=2703894 RepID=UPI00197C5991|nr:response regulator [Burkholderia sp. Ac-20353]MBN3786191.1 response regulator [Burkholderia sp. Ac-20353]
MNILIVDDELEKAQVITTALRDAGLVIHVEHRSTATAARRCIQDSLFDMLIIDLNLPDGLGVAPTQEGGLKLFDMLLLDEEAQLPPDVVFITSREELVADARQKAAERGAVLWQFRDQASSWKSMLVGRVKYLEHKRARSGVMKQVDIAILTALRSPELDAVLDLPYEWKSQRFAGDPSTYQFGSIQRSGASELSVVAAHAQRKGMPSSAALASKMVSLFQPRFLVMLGICAGIRGKTNLGDVIVADPTWDYGSGKRAQQADGSLVFLAAPHQKSLDPEISQVCQDLSKDANVVRVIRSGWNGSVPQGTLEVRIGPMASGAAVLADDEHGRLVALQNREVLAIEMEAYAVMAAIDYSSRTSNGQKPLGLVIKSVCDFADSSKSDDWQKYAAYTSAQFADQLFRSASVFSK